MRIKAQKVPPKYVSWGIASSPLGKVVVGVTAKGEVCRISFLSARNPVEIVAEWQVAWQRTYFTADAKPKDFMKRPLLMIGTEFQINVWRKIMLIPRGKTATYGEIARQTGKPGAARAIGAACGCNYLAYIVPCHRVVSTSGIGGYGSGGVKLKRELLKTEGINFKTI